MTPCTSGFNEIFNNKKLFGPFDKNKNNFQKTWAGLPPHYSVYISVDIIIYNNWNSENL
jgi:hypothetical protein